MNSLICYRYIVFKIYEQGVSSPNISFIKCILSIVGKRREKYYLNYKVLRLSVCLCVCLFVCLFVCMSHPGRNIWSW